jgi:hypothetical protein
MNSTGIKVRKPGHNRINPTKTAAGGKMRLKTLDHIDGRTLAARRAHELIAGISRDLGGDDDASQLTEGERQLIQRAAILGAMIESNEADWLGGDAVDLSNYFMALNVQRRILVTLGLERRSKDVTPPTMDEIAQRIEDDEAAAAAAADIAEDVAS